MNGSKVSAARKRIGDLHEEMRGLLEVLLRRRSLLRGCVYESRRRCGNPACRCVRGELHSSTVLAYRGRGRQRNLSPSGKELALVRKMTADYQRFRRSRARLVKAFQGLLDGVAVLEREGLAEGERRFGKTETGGKIE